MLILTATNLGYTLNDMGRSLMSEEQTNQPTVVIDRTDRESLTVTADQPINVIELDYAPEPYEKTLNDHRGQEMPQIIPGDMNDPDNPDSGGTFDTYETGVDEEYVTGVKGYTESESAQKRFGEIALQYFQEMEADETEQS